jgi:hypothetical protein
MGACPSDLAGPECGGPPASTDELKGKQSKVRDAGVKATAAKKGLSAAETKLSGLQAKLSLTQEELDGSDLRIAQKGEKVASAKPERKPAVLQEVEIEKAKKVRLEAEKARLNGLISSLQKDITTLKTASTDAETELTAAKQDLSSAIQRASDEAAAKKAAEEAAAAEAKQIEQQKADEAAAEAERLRQEEEVKAAAEAERLRQEAADKAAEEAERLRKEEEDKAAAEAARLALPPTEGQLRRTAMEVPGEFQPPEIPEGLTPEQRRRVRMGGPIPASAVTPLPPPPPPPPPSEITPGRERLDVLKQQSLNLNPIITKLFQYNFTEDQIRQTLKVLGVTDDKIDRDIAEVSATVEKNSLPRNVDDIVKTLKDMKIPKVKIQAAILSGLQIPTSEAFASINRVKGGRKTRRKRRGGNQPVKGETQKETTNPELKELPPVSPVLRGDLVKKGSLPKGGRRRTFRKKKIQQIEKQLEAIKKSLTDIIKE